MIVYLLWWLRPGQAWLSWHCLPQNPVLIPWLLVRVGHERLYCLILKIVRHECGPRSVILPCWPGASVLSFGLSWISRVSCSESWPGTHTTPWQKGSAISPIIEVGGRRAFQSVLMGPSLSWFHPPHVYFPSQLLALLAPAFSSDEEQWLYMDCLISLCNCVRTNAYTYLLF